MHSYTTERYEGHYRISPSTPFLAHAAQRTENRELKPNPESFVMIRMQRTTARGGQPAAKAGLPRSVQMLTAALSAVILQVKYHG